MDPIDFLLPESDLQGGSDFSDPMFRDVREVEAEQVHNLRQSIESIKTALRMAQGLVQMSAQPSYQQFIKAVADMRDHRTAELLAARTDRDSAMLIGRVQELRMILGLMQNTRMNAESLARSLKMQEDSLRQLQERISPEAMKP